MQWNELNINKKYVIITTTISIFVYHSEQKKAFIYEQKIETVRKPEK